MKYFMERLWTGDVQMKYPKQWVVMVNLSHEKKGCRVIGEVHLVTPDKKEAYAKAIALKKEGKMGKVTVVPGYDDTPQIGGLELWDSQ